MTIVTKWLPRIVFFLILAAMYFLAASPLGNWYVDDAGISFSYARNLGTGYGLVSQPNQTPVEGYSNPLWVLVLSLIPIANLDIVTIVKELSVGITIASLGVLYLALIKLGISNVFSMISIGWLICQPGFVIWTVSGLENPLYVFLLAVLFLIIINKQNTQKSIVAGLISGLISITRPEGIIYSCLYFLFHKKYAKSYLPTCIVVFGSYLIFRMTYFGDLFPVPYYKKTENIFSRDWWIISIAKFKNLILGLFGNKYLVIGIVTLLLLILLYLLWKNVIKRDLLILSAFVLVALGGFILLPKDWMEEYRYATPVFFFAYPLLAATFSTFNNTFPQKQPLRLITPLIFFSWAISTNFLIYKPRLEAFVLNPTVPMSGVAANFERFEEYAHELNEKYISVLTPDVGGALYYHPEILIYDLGGLTDPVIARTIDRNKVELRDYIFSELPDFIHVHGEWAYSANLEADYRFRTYYVPIYEYIDTSIQERYNIEVHSGDYVRRSLLSSPEQIDILFQLSQSPP